MTHEPDLQLKTETEAARESANIIFAQFGGYGKLRAMVGAHNFAFDRSPSATFRFKMARSATGNICKTILEADDTYTVEFWWARGAKCTLRKTYSDVYCDQLREIFESQTGLFLSF